MILMMIRLFEAVLRKFCNAKALPLQADEAAFRNHPPPHHCIDNFFNLKTFLFITFMLFKKHEENSSVCFLLNGV
eukprot:4463417-Amphidinium_carterae.1